MKSRHVAGTITKKKKKKRTKRRERGERREDTLTPHKRASPSVSASTSTQEERWLCEALSNSSYLLLRPKYDTRASPMNASCSFAMHVHASMASSTSPMHGQFSPQLRNASLRPCRLHNVGLCLCWPHNSSLLPCGFAKLVFAHAALPKPWPLLTTLSTSCQGQASPI